MHRPGTDLYIGGLHVSCTERELKDAFSAFGPVIDAVVLRNHGQSIGSGMRPPLIVDCFCTTTTTLTLVARSPSGFVFLASPDKARAAIAQGAEAGIFIKGQRVRVAPKLSKHNPKRRRNSSPDRRHGA